MPVQKRKFTRYTCQALSGSSPEAATINASTPAAASAAKTTDRVRGTLAAATAGRSPGDIADLFSSGRLQEGSHLFFLRIGACDQDPEAIFGEARVIGPGEARTG